MTNLRQAAQQALEALERGETKLRWAAITALRAALAEPQTTHWEGCEAVHPECKATPRKPLTDDELEPLLDAVPFYDIGNKDLINFARAIERAHGIGEQT